MSIDRFVEDDGRLVIDDEVRDYLDHMTPHDQITVPERPTCGVPLDQLTKCLLDPGHDDRHCGVRSNGTVVKW